MSDEKLDIHIQAEALDIQATRPQETIDWGVSLVQAPQVWTQTRGEGIKILVLDTGIDYRHPDITPNFKGGINFTNSRATDYMDRNGHGTHCSGIIAGADRNYLGIVGVAPGAHLYAGKVLNDNGSGSFDWLIRGLDFAVEKKMDIVSMSLGADFDPGEEVHAAIKRARDAGIILVAASGNEAGHVNWPAAYDEVIAVGAIDQAFDAADFSNFGEAVDVAAPGVDIYSSYPNKRYAKLSGTSMATPMVTGVIALLQAYARKKGIQAGPDRIIEMIKNRSVDVGDQGKDHLFGNGIINIYKLIKNFN